MNTFNISNKVQANTDLPNYLDIYIVLDNSGSMGIGADNENIAKIKSANNGCEVACHVWWDTSYNKIKALTSNKKIVMRIDVLRDAINNIQPSQV